MQIVPGVYSLDCAKRSHVFFIEKEVALIDTGIPGQTGTILNELKSLDLLQGLSFEWACPSHGTPAKNNGTLQQFITEAAGCV